MMQLSKDLRGFILLLNAASVEYLVVGAWAVGFHAQPRHTGDAELFLRRNQANAGRMVKVINKSGFVPWAFPLKIFSSRTL